MFEKIKESRNREGVARGGPRTRAHKYQCLHGTASPLSGLAVAILNIGHKKGEVETSPPLFMAVSRTRRVALADIGCNRRTARILFCVIIRRMGDLVPTGSARCAFRRVDIGAGSAV